MSKIHDIAFVFFLEKRGLKDNRTAEAGEVNEEATETPSSKIEVQETVRKWP